MNKRLSEEEVRKVAKLSRLDLTEAQITEFTDQLCDILDHVAKINELDTEGVEPLAHCLPVSNCFRQDVVKESLGTEKVLANAPQRDGQFFKVPKILDDNSAA